MSGYPVLLEGSRIEALVVGGGSVAQRKVAALLECGAAVRLVAPNIAAGVRSLAGAGVRLSLVDRAYQSGDIGGASLVVAATGDRSVNARVSADARAAGRLVIVADAPDEGNCTSAATHRVGALVIAVSAGGVPTAAARIRDALAARFDARYAAAVGSLSALRRRFVESDDRDAWRAANAALVGPDFCARVERGEFTAHSDAATTPGMADVKDAAWR